MDNIDDLNMFSEYYLNFEHTHVMSVVFYKSVNNGYMPSVLSLVFLISVLLTVSVIVSRNPIVSVLFLIGLFFSVACYLILLGLDFIGLSYLLVYVGAVSILFLFILMLINVRISELTSENTNSIPLVIIIALIFSYCFKKVLSINVIDSYFFILHRSIVYNVIPNYLYYNISNYFFDTYNNFYITSKVWDGYLAEMTHIASIGGVMYTNYSVWLILTSIILLLAMVGTIIITIKNNT